MDTVQPDRASNMYIYYIILFIFISDQVYCARGTVPKLHIKATSEEEGEGTSL